jgi:HlyD family secretion protein
MNNVFLYLLVAVLFACTQQSSTVTSAYVVHEGPLLYQSSWPGEFVPQQSTAIHVPDVDANYITVASVLSDGTPVQAGDVVLRFDSTIAKQELALEQAKADIERAELARTAEELRIKEIEINASISRKNFEQKQSSLKAVMSGSMISRLEKEKLELDIKKFTAELAALTESLKTFQKQKEATLKIAQLKVDAIESKVKKKEAHLVAMEVKAPVAGVVFGPYTRLNFQFAKVAAGSVVRPGDKVLEIPDLSRYDVIVYLRQKDANYLEVGNKVAIFPSIAPDQKLLGTVVEKDKFAISKNERMSLELPQGNFKEIKFKIRVEQTPSDIRPGNTARVEIDQVFKEKCLLVPLMYLREEQGKIYATRANGSKVEVHLGATTTSHAEIIAGLQAGDRIVFPR